MSTVGNSREGERRWALWTAGIISIAGAGGAAVLALVTLSTAAGPPELASGFERPPIRALLTSALVDAIAAVLLATVGWGCLRLRRWAPAAADVTGWIWLLVGVGLVILAPPFLEVILADGPVPIEDPTVAELAIRISVGLLALAGIVAPGLLIVLVRGNRVQRTCDRHDDRAPAQRVGPARMKLALSFVVLGLLLAPVAVGKALPVFTWLVDGIAAVVISLALSALLVWIGVAAWLKQPLAWWVAVGALTVIGLSGWVSLRTIPLERMLPAMGYDELTIRSISAVPPLWLEALVLSVAVGGLLYLVALRRRLDTL